jgi:GTP cyclohydrolase I
MSGPSHSGHNGGAGRPDGGGASRRAFLADPSTYGCRCGDATGAPRSGAHKYPSECPTWEDPAVLHPAVSEPKAQRRARLEWLGRALLETIGENAERPELKETPKRWAKWWEAFVDYEPGSTETAFEAQGSDQMVVVSGIRVWSLCEHHLLPFWCDVTIGYVARDRILGLSKFARIAHKYAHRLQVQERLVTQIADEVARVTGAPDVAVMAQGEHLCMTMRGIRSPALMTSSALRGVFAHNAASRAEFLSFVQQRR